jgi:DNA-binding response OmpR family regulator
MRRADHLKPVGTPSPEAVTQVEAAKRRGDSDEGKAQPMALILVADDDDDIRELVRLRLTAWGHEVLAVPDGEAARQAFHAHEVDLALLDVMMPRLTGLDVLIGQRHDEVATGHARVPVAMMSAKSQASDIAEAYRLGADDYIVKPFTLTALTTVVSAMTTRRPEGADRATA